MNAASSPSQGIAKTPSPMSFADHIRSQFESLQRQPELARDLTCFRPGNVLSSIRYVAHPHGLHVARWLKVLSQTQATVTIDTANPVPSFSNGFVTARPIVPRLLNIPMTLRYLVGGLMLRFSKKPTSREMIHAHCASGNGLMAWLSGHKYLIVTYGTEIFGADQRGFAYCWMMKKILQGAERIAGASPECAEILRDRFGVPHDRIYLFHLGYDEKHFCRIDHSQRMQLRNNVGLPADEPIWVVNRRTDPHYRTLEVVNGFLGYCEQNRAGRLVVLFGDHQSGYADTICNVIRSHEHGDRVTVVKQMLSPAEFAKWLQLSDFSISVPRTDNFSISILESMGCGTIPILSNLEGYNELRSCASVRWMSKFEPADFTTMFGETASAWSDSQEVHRSECLRFVQKGYSTERAIRDIAAFSLGTPLQKDEAIHFNRLTGKAA